MIFTMMFPEILPKEIFQKRYRFHRKEDHGGSWRKVWATSRLGIGTIMYFVLRKYQRYRLMSRILIIEDEEAIADLEKDYLELSGF